MSKPEDIANGLNINEFELSDMVENPAIVMIAKRGSGKSWVCRSILNHFRKIPAGMIIAPTDKMNSFYGKFFPDTFIHYEYKSEKIEKLIYRQELMIEKYKDKKKEGKKIDPRAFILMDDCLASKGTWMRDQPITTLLFNGRHYQLMYILTMQFPLGITPELRCNFDYIFLLAEDTHSNLKRIYDHYAGMFPTFDSFRQVLAQITNDFGFMTITNKGLCNTFLEKIKWHKSLNSQEFAKIPVTDLKKYNKLLEITKKLEEKSCKISELSDAESECSYKMSELSDTESECNHKNYLDIKSVASAKYDKLENLLLNIAVCNNNICKLVATKSVTDNRIDILENIVSSNCLITNFLSNK